MGLKAQVVEKDTSKETYEGVFGEILLIDNQTVSVPGRKTFEIDLQQRFGTVQNGYADGFGIAAPSNTRMGVYYTPIKNVMLGTGITRENWQWGLEAKYSIIDQGKSPVAISYFVNGSAVLNELTGAHKNKERLSFFHQLLFARAFSKTFSLQLAPSFSHFNKIEGSGTEAKEIDTLTQNHFAASLLFQYKLREHLSLVGEYDQPLTAHHLAKPYPNLGMGVLVEIGSYSVQVFAENYYNIDLQNSNMFNLNSIGKGQFLFGINLARSWHFGSNKKACHT